MPLEGHNQIDPTRVYVASEDVVARQIEDEFLLVPIASGIGDMEDALYTLNDTGRAIWEKLAPQKTVNDLIDELLEEFDAPVKPLRRMSAAF